MIPRIDKGFEHDLIVEYLEKHVETGSADIAKLLPPIVEGLPSGPEGSWHAAKIPPLIERAWQQVDDAESRGALITAESLLLERFGIDLRPTLGL